MIHTPRLYLQNVNINYLANHINVNTLKEAVSVALEMSCEGDYIILSPASCSFDMFKNYKEKANCFKEAVKEIRNGEY